MRATAQPAPTRHDLPELVKLRSLIESGFTHDWLLRIEHTGGSCTPGKNWQEWGQPAFAITDATTVVADVAECRVKHPTHAIRLSAEKLNPRTRMLYSIFSTAERFSPRLQTVPAPVAGMAPANDWLGAITTGMSAIGNRTWLAAAFIGILMSTALIS